MSTSQNPNMTFSELSPSFKTVSGKPLLIGTGTGTKWKDMKRKDPSTAQILVDQIKLSIEKGYYHLDTAEIYGTQPELGKALAESNVTREDLWITTKYSAWSPTSGPFEALEISLKELGTSYVDLYLIHSNSFDHPKANGLTLVPVWEQMIEAQKKGLARCIGVSNFDADAIQTVIDLSKKHGDEYRPRVNQMEFHPYLKSQFPGVYDLCQKEGILVEAYGPLTPIMRVETKDHPLTEILPKLGAKYGKTDAQILLRWVWQKNVLPITTSGNEERIKQSLDIYDFALTDEEVKTIDSVEDKFPFRGFTFMV